MYGVWEGLLSNMGMVAAVIVLWANVRDFARRLGARGESVVFGLVMSGGTMLAMMMALKVSPGVILDLRVAPLAVAGFFGGPLAAGIAAGPALVYRAWLGGNGGWGGCLEIAFLAMVGVLARPAPAARPARFPDVLLLAVLAAATDILCFFALPPDLVGPTLRQIAAPAASLDLIGVGLAGLSLLGEERRRELIASNALFRAVIEALPDCLNVKDLDGRFIAANSATARLMRTSSADDLIGKTDFDFYPYATAQRFRAEEVLALREQREVTVEQDALFAVGAKVWLSTLKVPFRDPEGEIIGLITHNRDVTTSKVMQIELNATRQHLADALASMADGVVMYDSEGTILFCNSQYQSIFPLTADVRVPGARMAEVLRQAVSRGEEQLPADLTIGRWVTAILGSLKTENSRLIALADGRWIETRNRPTANGGSLTMFTDVTARKKEEEVLRHRAERDPLTGLANRATFEARLARTYDRASEAGLPFAIMLVDLDTFKQVNDSFGHKVGDHLLVNVARRLEAACRHGDLVARLGGDEFAILSEGLSSATGVPRLAQRILDGLATPFDVGNVRLRPSGSIGYTVFPDDPSGPEDLVVHADEALYAAKASGRRKAVAYPVETAARVAV